MREIHYSYANLLFCMAGRVIVNGVISELFGLARKNTRPNRFFGNIFGTTGPNTRYLDTAYNQNQPSIFVHSEPAGKDRSNYMLVYQHLEVMKHPTLFVFDQFCSPLIHLTLSREVIDNC